MQDIQALFTRLEQDARSHNHRRLLILSGTQLWCHEQLTFLQHREHLVWIGRSAPVGFRALENKQCQRLLGQTVSHLIYDAWDGLNPDSFGQISGCLEGGAIMLLLCPDLDSWPEYDDPEHQSLVAYPYQPSDAGRRFIARFVHLLEDDGYAVVVRQSASDSGIELELPSSQYIATERTEPVLPSKTVDQQHAVELLLSQFRRGRRPVVITADRGRGKSVALGIAAAQLSGLDFSDIILTAPEYSATESAFAMAHQLLPDYQFSKGLLRDKTHKIRFLEPEQVLREPGDGQILLVDEAAAIPVPTLKAMLNKFPRIAFSSTIHGYEGTGQGFNVRFRTLLEKQAPNCKSIHLREPIRWAENDPLESLVFNLLMLNAEPAPHNEVRVAHAECETVVERLDRDQLIADYLTLGQVFGLLVLAHYRTTPGDLRVLLDSPNLDIWAMRSGGVITGVVLVATEGPLQPTLVDAIWSGHRRPRGHLLPQTLVGQEGCKEAAELRYGRVMRIAIHPALQRQHLGSMLLQQLKASLQTSGWDCLGSSFSASPDLLNFWQHNGFETVRIGSATDAVSGNHAGVVLCALSEQGRAVQYRLRDRFLEQLNYRLSDDLIDLEPELICVLLQHAGHLPELTQHDKDDLVAFARHNRSYESCAYAIHKLVFHLLDSLSDETLQVFLANPDFVLLVRRNLQQHSWSTLERNGQGRKQMMQQLRQIVSLMLERVEPLRHH
jgi:tRNA(Met) cytidine acetyltransferase